MFCNIKPRSDYYDQLETRDWSNYNLFFLIVLSDLQEGYKCYSYSDDQVAISTAFYTRNL
jgi:hypothetical protein